MDPFLRQTAGHYFTAGGIESLCFIFPNRRAASFFKKYLSEEVRLRNTVPQIAPTTITINDFFYRASGKNPTDRISLLLLLYEEYSALLTHPEPLDDFIFWGDVLLSDFDDVDKYLVEAKHIFTNVSEFREMQDDFSYLSESQRDAMSRFLNHFGEDKGEFKKRFLTVWDILCKLYFSFRERLSRAGMSYEGMVYRELAERLGEESVSDILSKEFKSCSKFVFVGLNALNECEKKLMRKMRDAGIAEFCWDYSSGMIKDPRNKSSFFMSVNVSDFPQAFKFDENGLESPQINVLSVPSDIGQAKQLPSIFRKIQANGLETAIVLPDEGLLIPVINSIPPEITKLNVTMGYPMGGSEVWSLFKDIAALQMHTREKNGELMFYHRQVWSVFSNSLVKSSLSPEGNEAVSAIRKEARYYIPKEAFKTDSLLEAIFTPISESSEAGEYLLNILKLIASRIRNNPQMGIELDFAKLYYESVERLSAAGLQIKLRTYFRLLEKIIGGSSIPFEGMPLEGLQIMGPLETRALDFENLIILNCNEGMFPRRSVSSSFIPPQLRKGFGLPTYEHQDAVWAYYFYRMIQRSKNVWMLFDSRSEGLRGGEPSRYISQMEMHFKLPVKRFVVSAPLKRKDEEEYILKTAKDLEKLHSGHLSASSLQNYLNCPAKFYYQSVCGLKGSNEVSESLDAGMQGKVFHATMEELYSGKKTITRKDALRILADQSGISSIVEKHILEELHSFEITGRNIIYKDVVCRYVSQVIRRDIELMDRYGVDQFRLFGLEKVEKMQIGGFSFVGYIDRLDSFATDEVRVVDYKTGKVTDKDFRIDEGNALEVVNALFGDSNAKRPGIALQLYLYDRFVSAKEKVEGKRIVNSIYQISRLFVDEVENVELSPVFCQLMEEKLEELLEEISDTDVPWRRTRETESCKWCDFKMICGR